MESFMEAFKRLGVRVQLQFCSDIDANCRTWLSLGRKALVSACAAQVKLTNMFF